MAAKKRIETRNSSVSIKVVRNGYKVECGNGVGSVISISGSGIYSFDGDSGGEFVFQDFAAMVAFLRKRLSVPSA